MSSLLIFIDMKQQKVQALTSAEVSEILALQKWATYSQEYPIRYACTLNGALVQVDSFGIDNLPKLDALALLLGSDLSRKIASGQTPHLFLIEFHLFHFRYIF